MMPKKKIEYPDHGPVISRERCPTPGCDGAGNNVAVYKDGHKHCWACGEKPAKQKGLIPEDKRFYSPLKTRCLTEQTCRYGDYQVGQYTGTIEANKDGKVWKVQVEDLWVTIQNGYNGRNQLIWQKIKWKDHPIYGKGQKILGQSNNMGLVGKWKYPANENMFVVLTEGEEDRLSVMQSQGVQFPVLSIPLGVNSARKYIEQDLTYLMGFKHVILGFDNDEHGQKAADDVLELFEYGKVKIAKWPAKDANDLLKQGEGSLIKDSIWKAQVYEPTTIVSLGQLRAEILQQVSRGTSYGFPTMDDITYGRQKGECHIVVGPTNVGKTELMKELTTKAEGNIGIFSFEQTVKQAAQRFIGSKVGSRIHLPEQDFPIDKINQVVDDYAERIFYYKKPGLCDIRDLFLNMQYMAKVKNVTNIVIDNLKALQLFEKAKAEAFMNNIQAFKLATGVTVWILSHVNKDPIKQSTHVGFSSKLKEGQEPHQNLEASDIKRIMNKFQLSWSTGRMPTKEHIDGHSVIADLADYVWALARNTEAEDRIEQRTLQVKALKTKLDGRKDGKTFSLYYNDKGQYEEIIQSNIKPYTEDSSNDSKPY